MVGAAQLLLFCCFKVKFCLCFSSEHIWSAREQSLLFHFFVFTAFPSICCFWNQFTSYVHLDTLRDKRISRRLVMRLRLCVFRRASNRIIIFSLNRFASSFLLHFFISTFLLTFLKTNFPLFLNLSLNIYTSPSNGLYFLSFRLFIILRKGFLWCHLKSTVSLVFSSFESTQNISFLFCLNFLRFCFSQPWKMLKIKYCRLRAMNERAKASYVCFLWFSFNK